MEISRTFKRGNRYLLDRVTNRDYYKEPGSYWNARHVENAESLVGVGHRSLTEQENDEDYEHKWEQLETLLARLAPSGATVLDAGCGVGFFSKRLASAGYRVTGVDFAPDAIERAKAEDTDGAVAWTVSALETLDVGEFDVVLNVDVLYHIVDDELWERSVRHLSNAVAPGGLLMIQESLVQPSRLRRLVSVRHLRLRSLDDYRRVLGDVDQRRYDMRHERAHKDVIWWRRPA